MTTPYRQVVAALVHASLAGIGGAPPTLHSHADGSYGIHCALATAEAEAALERASREQNHCTCSDNSCPTWEAGYAAAQASVGDWLVPPREGCA